jgi:citrate lyase beta subunit
MKIVKSLLNVTVIAALSLGTIGGFVLAAADYYDAVKLAEAQDTSIELAREKVSDQVSKKACAVFKAMTKQLSKK